MFYSESSLLQVNKHSESLWREGFGGGTWEGIMNLPGRTLFLWPRGFLGTESQKTFILGVLQDPAVWFSLLMAEYVF